MIFGSISTPATLYLDARPGITLPAAETPPPAFDTEITYVPGASFTGHVEAALGAGTSFAVFDGEADTGRSGVIAKKAGMERLFLDDGRQLGDVADPGDWGVLADQGASRLPGFRPGWTDHADSDPGVTLLSPLVQAPRVGILGAAESGPATAGPLRFGDGQTGRVPGSDPAQVEPGHVDLSSNNGAVSAAPEFGAGLDAFVFQPNTGPLWDGISPRALARLVDYAPDPGGAFHNVSPGFDPAWESPAVETADVVWPFDLFPG
ncbi:hypothetical protein HKCCE2091_14830 [Rhodobacterales bacterium HKCCE2091]|nr:hypothetical protein [Rhodobacterales bacterium HKCCE2091]